MSVQLTPFTMPGDDPWLDVGNETWREMTAGAGFEWDGKNDPKTYTPVQLRLIASALPAEYEKCGWKESLLDLAESGGAILS